MSKPVTITTEILVSELSDNKNKYVYQAPEAERLAIAERFSILSLNNFVAEVNIASKGEYDGIKVWGKIEASLTQQCVATLNPVDEEIDETFELLLVDAATVDRLDREEAYLDPDMPDYDLMEEEKINPVEIAVQTLSIMMNPYPRSLDGDLAAPSNANISVNQDELKKPNPFSVLSALKDKS